MPDWCIRQDLYHCNSPANSHSGFQLSIGILVLHSTKKLIKFTRKVKVVKSLSLTLRGSILKCHHWTHKSVMLYTINLVQLVNKRDKLTFHVCWLYIPTLFFILT